jgi:hypothetical protein
MLRSIINNNNKPVTAALYKKGISEPKEWRSLESLFIVLRLRKCDKIRNFHRKKSTHALKM